GAAHPGRRRYPPRLRRKSLLRGRPAPPERRGADQGDPHARLRRKRGVRGRARLGLPGAGSAQRRGTHRDRLQSRGAGDLRGPRLPLLGGAEAAMRALVTGGTGFVGSQVVRALLEDGVEVRVLARSGSDRRALTDLPIEIATGDLGEPASLKAPLQGVEVLYHVVADYRLWAPDPAVLYRVNVGG